MTRHNKPLCSIRSPPLIPFFRFMYPTPTPPPKGGVFGSRDSAFSKRHAPPSKRRRRRRISGVTPRYRADTLFRASHSISVLPASELPRQGCARLRGSTSEAIYRTYALRRNPLSVIRRVITSLRVFGERAREERALCAKGGRPVEWRWAEAIGS